MTDLSIQMMARVQKLGKAGMLGTNYKRGPQGNEIVDYRADYLDRYGAASKNEIVSTVEDKRDNRDPSVVGAEYLFQKASASNGEANGQAVPYS
jgi:hypothetical protein